MRLLTVTLACIAGSAVVIAQQTQTPVFTSRTWLVPIDVRVVDSGGKPVTGLTAGDFTVTEDKVRQTVAHFSALTLVPDPAAAAVPILRANETPVSLESANRRVFLIVLGRGRLQPPAKGVDAALTFVQSRLLPQDQVAVHAYNRATDFTTDRSKIAGVLGRFRSEHERIEALLKHQFTGLQAIYGGNEPAPETQAAIDRIFTGQAPMRELAPGRSSDSQQLAADATRAIDEQARLTLLKDRQQALAAMGKSLSAVDNAALQTATSNWVSELGSLTPMALSPEDYFGEAKLTLNELQRLYSAIDYLRFIEGEKHIVYITEQGMYLPRVETDLSLAAAANNARVTISIIQTGGLVAPAMPMSAASTVCPPGNRACAQALTPQGEPLTQRLVIGSIKGIAELTGGIASVYDSADNGLRRVTDATSTGYLLGYYSTNSAFDGQFRRVTVTVNRRGARPLYRHGYYAEAPRTPLDRRRGITYSRIVSAVNHPADLNDLRFNLQTSTAKGEGRQQDFIVDLVIDPSRIAFTDTGGVRTAELDIAVFCQDQDGDKAGDNWLKVPVRLTPAQWAEVSRTGLKQTVRVPVTTGVAAVKVVVYDFGSDRLGSAMKLLRSIR